MLGRGANNILLNLLKLPQLEDTNEISQALKQMQNRVIGLFKPRFFPVGEYIPVIANDNGMLTCITISTLLGLQTLHIGAEAGRYVEFPKTSPAYDRTVPVAQTLADMMKDPIAFDKWYKTNVYH